MLATASAVFHQLHAARIIPAVLLGRVIAFFTLGTRQGNDWTDIFLGSHNFLYRPLEAAHLLL